MRETSKNKILARIYGNGRGWAFSPKDFAVLVPRRDIDVALSTLANENKIRRVIRGIYDYPIYSELLKSNVASDLSQVARAIARKFSWRIIPTGETALNYFGLSTQIQSNYAYLSDGPSKSYKIDSRILQFKHSALKNLSFKNANSALIVQAIMAIGQGNITFEMQKNLSNKFSTNQWQKIKLDTKNTTGWIYKIICDIYSEMETENE